MRRWTSRLALLAVVAGCARARASIVGDAPPVEVSSFVADFDSARVLVIALQGRIERYPDRLMVVVEQAALPPMPDGATLRAALVARGAPAWTFRATSAAVAGDWIEHGGGAAPWTPMRFVIPVRDSTGEAQRDLAFVFESGAGERGGLQRRVVPADVRRAAPDDR